MEKKRFKLSPKDTKAFEVELKNAGDNKHLLLRLSDGDFCNTLNITFISENGGKEETIDATTFRQFDLQNYSGFSVSGNFTNARGFVEGDIYTGNWEEIVLNEIELSFSDAPFYYQCDIERIDFAIGTKDQSRVHVEAFEGGFSVTSTIIHNSKKVFNSKRTFSDISDGAQIIKRLYGRMKGRVKGVGFDERQEGQKAKLTQQFNKTLAESFRFSK